MPRHDLTDLDDETLRRMEVEGRQGLQSRVQTLHDIHTLLDVAMLQMRRYTEVHLRVSALPPQAPPPPTTLSTNGDGGSSDQTAAPASSGSTSSTAVTTDTGKSPLIVKKENDQVNISTSTTTSATTSTTSSTSASGSSTKLGVSIPATTTTTATTTSTGGTPSPDAAKDSIANDNDSQGECVFT